MPGALAGAAAVAVARAGVGVREAAGRAEGEEFRVGTAVARPLALAVEEACSVAVSALPREAEGSAETLSVGVPLKDGAAVLLHPVPVAMALGVPPMPPEVEVGRGSEGDAEKVAAPSAFGVAVAGADAVAEAVPARAMSGEAVKGSEGVDVPRKAEGVGMPAVGVGSVAEAVAAGCREAVGTGALSLALTLGCSVPSAEIVTAAAEGVLAGPKLLDTAALRVRVEKRLSVCSGDGMGGMGEAVPAPVSVGVGAEEREAMRGGEAVEPVEPVRSAEAVESALREAVGVAAGVCVGRGGVGVAVEEAKSEGVGGGGACGNG